MSFNLEFETEEHRAAFEAGKEFILKGMISPEGAPTPDAVEIELLVEQQLDREVVAEVMPSLIEWRAAAAHGDLGYIVWLKSVIAAPFRSGILVLILLLLTVPVTLVAGMLGYAYERGRTGRLRGMKIDPCLHAGGDRVEDEMAALARRTVASGKSMYLERAAP